MQNSTIKFTAFEDLRLHVTAGADIAQGQQDTDIAPSSPLKPYYGYNGWSKQLKRNLTFNTYAQYYHDFKVLQRTTSILWLVMSGNTSGER